MIVNAIKDLRVRFGVARDQGLRPTCVSFATSDLHASARRAVFAPLSVEYLYFKAVQRSASVDPHGGVSLLAITNALALDGQPLELDWPYLPAIPDDISHWKPPSEVETFKKILSQRGSILSTIVQDLDRDRATLLALRVSEAFYQPDDNGMIHFIPNDPDTGNHAVIAVGYGMFGMNQVVLVRNSWGIGWGINGYAWLHADYVTTRFLASSSFE